MNPKKEKIKNFFWIMSWLFIFSSLVFIIHCESSYIPEKYADVALYSDRGCWSESVQAGEKMFQWMGYSVALVDADYINKKGLDTFGILCIPGGDMFKYSQDISSGGKSKIRNFISNGGGYIGICGGAYFAGKKIIWQGNQLPTEPLGLYNGTAMGPLNEIIRYPDYGMCKVKIEDVEHSITQSVAESMWMLYYWGPALVPQNAAEVSILGRYAIGNKPVILAFELDNGRVFLIGTHPEIEEDSNRDGVTWGDELIDWESDWDLMKSAVHWCFNESGD